MYDHSTSRRGAGLWILATATGLLWMCLAAAEALRFELDTRECWVHEVPSDGDLLSASFVVIKVHNPWGVHHRRAANVGVDITIADPDGQEVHSMKQQTEGQYNGTAIHKGPYTFCFQNGVSMLQIIDFHVHIGHVPRDEHIKEEHLRVLMAQIARVENALFDVQFEQHWLHSQSSRQVQVAIGMSRRVLYKAAVESLSLVACSALQIVLLQRLFEKKLGFSPPRV